MVGQNVKVRSNVILVLPNVTMKLSNVKKTIREPLNMTQVKKKKKINLTNVQNIPISSCTNFFQNETVRTQFVTIPKLVLGSNVKGLNNKFIESGLRG